MQKFFSKIFFRLIIVLLCLILVTPLIVTPTLIAPFITGKGFFFRLCVEIAFVFWLPLLIINPQYRFKFTFLVKTISTFIFFVLVANLTSQNPTHAIFGNYERMSGFIEILHIYVYFLILISILRTRFLWLLFFNISAFISFIVSLLGLYQKYTLHISRAPSTPGNPEYLAVYLLFNIGFLAFLIYEFWFCHQRDFAENSLRLWWMPQKKVKRSQSFWFVLLYVLILFVDLFVLFNSGTRSSVLGIFCTGFLFSFIIALSKLKEVKIRKNFFQNQLLKSNFFNPKRSFFYITLIISIVWMRLIISNDIRSNTTIKRIINFSFHEQSFKSRFVNLKMSLRAILEHPFFGWGQENYYLVLQKYYDPSLGLKELWFDRSHNVLLDWGIYTGFLGLFLYLLIFVLIFLKIKGAYSKKLISLAEVYIFNGIILSYLIQNLFFFDHLLSYLMFFSLIAFIELRSQQEMRVFSNLDTSNQIKNIKMRKWLLPFAINATIIPIFAYIQIYKPFQEARLAALALELLDNNKSAREVIDTFKQALKQDSFGNIDVIEHLYFIANGVFNKPEYSLGDKKEFLDFVANELRKLVQSKHSNLRHQIFLCSLLISGMTLHESYPQIYRFEVENILEKARNINPNNPIIAYKLSELEEFNPNSTQQIFPIISWDSDL